MPKKMEKAFNPFSIFLSNLMESSDTNVFVWIRNSFNICTLYVVGICVDDNNGLNGFANEPTLSPFFLFNLKWSKLKWYFNKFEFQSVPNGGGNKHRISIYLRYLFIIIHSFKLILTVHHIGKSNLCFWLVFTWTCSFDSTLGFYSIFQSFDNHSFWLNISQSLAIFNIYIPRPWLLATEFQICTQ